MLPRVIALAVVLTFPVETLAAQAPVVPRGVLRGVVLDLQGMPAAGVFVQLMADSIGEMKPPATRPPRMSYVIDYKSTGSDGRFSFSMPAARRHSLIANGVLTEGKAESLFVGAGDTLTLDAKNPLIRSGKSSLFQHFLRTRSKRFAIPSDW